MLTFENTTYHIQVHLLLPSPQSCSMAPVFCWSSFIMYFIRRQAEDKHNFIITKSNRKNFLVTLEMICIFFWYGFVWLSLAWTGLEVFYTFILDALTDRLYFRASMYLYPQADKRIGVGVDVGHVERWRNNNLLALCSGTYSFPDGHVKRSGQ